METKIIWTLVMIALFGAMVTTASAAETEWSDTFTDSSNISASENITVAGGDVKLANVTSSPCICGGGTDHGGAGWSPGADVYGCHYNIGTCTIDGTTVKAYSGGDYGWLEIHATTINVAGSGLNGTGRGYPGGAGAGHYYYPNGSYWHPGYGTGYGGTHNKVDGAGQHPDGTEGYKLSAGGGGGHGNSGGKGVGYYCGMYGHDCSDGGDAYGTSDTKQATIGAGGAGAGGGYEGELPPPYKWGGDGGAGGASILLDATTLAINGMISVIGEDGGDGEDGYKGTGGGGGGAGGSIVIIAGTLSGSGSLYAEGGDGGDCGNGSSHTSGGGGGAAGGRIKIWNESSTFSGSYSVMNGSAGAGAETGYGYGGPGEPGEAGTYCSAQESYSPYTPGYKPSGYLNSTAITPASFSSWDKFFANHTMDAGTSITYRILNASDNSTLCEVNDEQAAAGYDIPESADYTTSIRLYAFLNTTNTDYTPTLHDWNVSWTLLDDITPPVSITNLQNTTHEETYINWTWTDPEDADFSHVMVYVNGVPKPNVTKGVQGYNATGLSPNNSYAIGTHTVDTTGNVNQTWMNHTAWTAPSSDMTPPASVTNLQNVSYEQTYINWTWTDPGDADFSHVMVYLNGVPRPNVTKGVQSYNATGLSPNNSYEIATHTVDTTGNVNQTWENHTAWTAPSSGTQCGDVNEDGVVNWDDVETLWYDYADHPYPGAYTITNEWAADVNCDGEINMDDVMTLWYDVKDYPSAGAYEVHCCG